jgi:hypothetical protein
LSGLRPTAGVRYALERAEVTSTSVAYAGFAHLPDADVPLDVRIALPGGAVQASARPAPGVTEARAADLAKVASALVRAATKSEIAAGQALPRKIVRWRG